MVHAHIGLECPVHVINVNIFLEVWRLIIFTVAVMWSLHFRNEVSAVHHYCVIAPLQYLTECSQCISAFVMNSVCLIQLSWRSLQNCFVSFYWKTRSKFSNNCIWLENIFSNVHKVHLLPRVLHVWLILIDSHSCIDSVRWSGQV